VAVAGGSRRADIARTKEKIIRKMMMK